jgi:hypothetical protein
MKRSQIWQFHSKHDEEDTSGSLGWQGMRSDWFVAIEIGKIMSTLWL